MRQFVILSDTGSDLPRSYYEEHAVEEIPLGFTMDGVTYGGEEGEAMSAAEFYARLRAGSMPKTFQVSPDQAAARFTAHAEKGEDMLVLGFSSGLSGTLNSYRLAARDVMEKYPSVKIAVVDTLAASLGEGLFVDYVVKKADTGASLEETEAYALGIAQHICHYFTVEDLFHLKRGGRVSSATAIMGTMLNIKPVLYVDSDGHLIPVGKAMGRKKSISALVDKMKETGAMSEGDPIFISHGDCMKDVEFLSKLIQKEFPGHPLFVNEIGPVIGAHSGAGTLAVFFWGVHR